MDNIALLGAAAADDTNRPLAIATVVISAILIVAGIAYVILHRDGGAPIDDAVFKALDSVEWYASDVGDELIDAPSDQRQQIVSASSERIGAAHATLLAHAPVVDDRDWEQLVVELTKTESAYNAFAQAEVPDQGAIAQHRHVLTEKLDQFRNGLT